MNREGTVFVVDDDPGALRSMCWLLESEGLPFEAFSSARDFLAAYNSDRPGCLLLDLRMPEVDGLELQETLLERGDPLPTIFVTGHGDVPKCASAMKRGAVDLLEKPVNDRELLELVKGALRSDQQRHRLAKEETELSARIDSLTSREEEVMRLLFDGNTIKQIAAEFGIGYQTVAKHRTSVMKKLRVENEAELVRLLVRHGLRPS